MPREKKISKYYIAAALVIAAIIGGVGSRFFLGPDNIVEEAAENIIEKNTGFSVDLSPQTQENFYRGRA
jgi:hypothetical protein